MVSKRRHVLVTLREELNLTQRGLARLSSCSHPTIQAIELGKLALSQRLACRIAARTGADTKWLLANNLDRRMPPLREVQAWSLYDPEDEAWL